jgi:hypothetical protein
MILFSGVAALVRLSDGRMVLSTRSIPLAAVQSLQATGVLGDRALP